MKYKKSLTSLDVAVLVKELKECVINALIDNVYVLSEDIYVFKLIVKGVGEAYLYLEPSMRISLSRYKPRVKTSPLLGGRQTYIRKLLRDGRVIGIQQVDFDRIVKFKVRSRKGKVYEIVVELMPRGIFAIVDERGVLVYVSKEMRVRDRELRIGKMYVPPPSINVFKLSLSEFKERLLTSKDIVRGLIRGVGLPPEVAEEVLKRLGLNKHESPKSLSDSAIKELYYQLIKFIDDVIRNPKPVIVYVGDKPALVLPFKPTCLTDEYVIKDRPSFNEAVDEYFRRVLTERAVGSKVSELEGEIRKLEKTIAKQDELISKFHTEIERINNLINTIYSNYLDLERVMNCVRNTVKSLGWNKVFTCGDVVDVNAHEGAYSVRLGDHVIRLNVRLTLKDYVIRLQKKLSDLKRRLEGAKEHKEELVRRLKELKSKRIELLETIPALVVKREWYHKYHWLISSDGFLVIGGRNAEQNESLIRKYLGDNDVFVHADIQGGSVVIVRTEGKEPTERTIYEASVLAACHSKAWKAGLGAIDVFWVWGKQVSKKAPSGEYLPKGSFMIYGRKNYIRNVPLRLAIGVEVKDSSIYVIQGPEDLVSERCDVYVVIMPGELRKVNVVKEIRNHFIKYDHRLSVISEEDISRVVPGSSRILKRYP